jgi:rod shape-determining protein MreC
MNKVARHWLVWLLLLGAGLLLLLVPSARALGLRCEALSALQPALGRLPTNRSEPGAVSEAGAPAGESAEERLERLGRDVDRLRAENARLHDEAHALRAQLGAAPERGGQDLEGVLARVLAREVLWQEPIFGLDRGTSDGLRAGAGALYRGMVVGRIVATAQRASCLALLTHRGVSISARLEECRAEGVVQGTRDAGPARECRMKVVGEELKARLGERVVTSGLDGCFPPGCWLGEVTQIERSGNLEWVLAVRPACETRQIEAVHVLTSAPLAFPWPKAPRAQQQ